MSAHKAVLSYLGKDGQVKLNCAQAVANAFKDKFLLSQDSFLEMGQYGGGRAPEGVCGALYAAQVILEKADPVRAKQCAAELLTQAGSLKCREIRASRRLSCVGCVETVAKYMEQV